MYSSIITYKRAYDNVVCGAHAQVTAKGCPDVPLSWMYDLHLSIAKLFGKLCGATLDVSKGTIRRA